MSISLHLGSKELLFNLSGSPKLGEDREKIGPDGIGKYGIKGPDKQPEKFLLLGEIGARKIGFGQGRRSSIQDPASREGIEKGDRSCIEGKEERDLTK